MPTDSADPLHKQWRDEVHMVLTSAVTEMRKRLGNMHVEIDALEAERPKFVLPLGLGDAERRYAAQIIDDVWGKWEDRYHRVSSWERWLLAHEGDTGAMTPREFSDYMRRKRAARGKAKAEA
jgi:hypothetical protein